MKGVLMDTDKQYIKPPVELVYARQLAALAAIDEGNRRPEGWRLSPKAVRDFVLGRAPVEYQGEQVEIDMGTDPRIDRPHRCQATHRVR
jgi:hypothetical protein